MRTQRLAVVLLTAGALAVGMADEGTAFRINKPGPIWRVLPSEPPPFMHWDLREFFVCGIPYTINPNCADLGNETALTHAAAETWSLITPSTTVLFRLPEATALDTILHDSESVIYWEGAPDDTWLGVTMLWPWPFAATGVIQESDIALNDKYFTWGDDAGAFDHQLAVGGGAGPFDMTAVLGGAGPHLTVDLNGGDVRNITFVAGDFATPSAATRQEISAAINARIGGATAAYAPWSSIADDWEGNVLLVNSSAVHPGGGKLRTIELGGPAQAVLGFPAGVQTVSHADVQSVVLHELGHFMGLADLYEATTQHGGAEVMYGWAPALGAKRTLHPDDRRGINFLHTPDIADAHDPPYPSRVHDPGTGRLLNGYQLDSPGDGAEHIFGTDGPGSLDGSYLYEWLGDETTGECEFNEVNPPADGVVFNAIGGMLHIEVTVTTALDAAGGFHDYSTRHLYLNVWSDWNADGDWDDANEHVIGPGEIVDLTPPGQQVHNYQVPIPNPGDCTCLLRARLDWGEDAGAVQNIDGALNGPRGAAQFGEVEDLSYCGDANGDCMVNVGDIVYLVRYLYKKGPPPLGRSDVNCDGIVNVADVVYLVGYLYRNGPPPCDPDGDLVPDC